MSWCKTLHEVRVESDSYVNGAGAVSQPSVGVAVDCSLIAVEQVCHGVLMKRCFHIVDSLVWRFSCW